MVKNIVIVLFGFLYANIVYGNIHINRYEVAYNYICSDMNETEIFVPMTFASLHTDVEDFINYFEVKDSLFIRQTEIFNPEDSCGVHEYHCFYTKFVLNKIDSNYSVIINHSLQP